MLILTEHKALELLNDHWRTKLAFRNCSFRILSKFEVYFDVNKFYENSLETRKSWSFSTEFPSPRIWYLFISIIVIYFRPFRCFSTKVSTYFAWKLPEFPNCHFASKFHIHATHKKLLYDIFQSEIFPSSFFFPAFCLNVLMLPTNASVRKFSAVNSVICVILAKEISESQEFSVANCSSREKTPRGNCHDSRSAEFREAKLTAMKDRAHLHFRLTNRSAEFSEENWNDARDSISDYAISRFLLAFVVQFFGQIQNILIF